MTALERRLDAGAHHPCRRRRRRAARAPTQRFVDRFAAVYTPAVFVLALAVAVSGRCCSSWTWMQSLYKALVLLVIACPCALVISTPVTIVSGLAAAARRGILIKGGVLPGERAQAAARSRSTRPARSPKASRSWSTGRAVGRHGRERRRPRSPRRWRRLRSPGVARDRPGPAAEHADAGTTSRPSPGAASRPAIDGVSYVLGNHRLIEERGQCSPRSRRSCATHEERRPHGRRCWRRATAPSACSLSPTRSRPSSREAVRSSRRWASHPSC